MALQFDAAPYLAAFQAGQNRDEQRRQQYAQALQSIPQGIQGVADIQQQQRQNKYQAIMAGMQAQGQGYNPNPIMSALGYSNLGGQPQTAQPMQPSSQPPQSQPQQLPGYSSPEGLQEIMGQQGMSPTMPSQPSTIDHFHQITGIPDPRQQNQQPMVSQPTAQSQPSGLFQKLPQPDYGKVIGEMNQGQYAGYQSLGEKPRGDIEKIREFNLRQQELEAKQKELKQTKDLTLGTKEDQFVQHEWDKIMEKHNPDVATQRSSIGISARLINSADRALETLKDRSHPLTYQDLGNVQQDIASIYQNGSPTDAAMKHNEYSTIFSTLGKTLQTLTGKPTDSVPEAIRRQLIDRLNLLKDTSYGVINRDFDTVETGQRRIINNRKDEWSGVRQKWAKSSQNVSGNQQGQQQIGRFKVTVSQ